MDIAPAPLQPDEARALSPVPHVPEPPPAPVMDSGLAGAATSPAAKAAYPPPAAMPTQLGPEGIRFDFTFGARVLLPQRDDGGLWRVRLRDFDTGNVLFESENRGALVSSTKRWFVRFRVEVWSREAGADGPGRLVLSHDYDAGGREVLVHFPVGTLGDILACFPMPRASPTPTRAAASPARCRP